RRQQLGQRDVGRVAAKVGGRVEPDRAGLVHLRDDASASSAACATCAAVGDRWARRMMQLRIVVTAMMTRGIRGDIEGISTWTGEDPLQGSSPRGGPTCEPDMATRQDACANTASAAVQSFARRG